MINGVLLIVAAVLFAVLYLFEGLGVMWLWIAAFLLAARTFAFSFSTCITKSSTPATK